MKQDRPLEDYSHGSAQDKMLDLPSSEQIINLLPSPVYLTNNEGYITLYNEAAAELWGRRPEIGKEQWCGWWKVFNPDGTPLDPGEGPMAETIRTKHTVKDQEILIQRPDGSLRNILPHPVPIFDNSGIMIGALNMLEDITDRKKSEELLKETEHNLTNRTVSLEREIESQTKSIHSRKEDLVKSEERYHKMIEEVEDYAIILMDENGIIQNWNKGAERIKGYKENEIVGKSFENFYTPEDRASNLPQKLLTQARTEGKALQEGWRLRKDGTRFWGSIVITSIHDHENRILGFTKVTRDLTERKNAEDKLKDYTARLEFQNRELEQFAYAASHDMKEPLRKIHFYNHYVSENAEGKLDEKSREFLNRSMNAVKRMSQLIEDLLTYSKTTSSTEYVEEVDLNEIADELILNHKEELDQKKVSIESKHLPVIQGVPFQLKQLFDNLINNSIKYKHPNRNSLIRISHKIVPGTEIKREGVIESKYHKISITDNGIGFDTAQGERIFEIFQRLNNQSGVVGSGIGLAICKKIVQNHDGFIEASGTPGEGARFDIYLPLS